MTDLSATSTSLRPSSLDSYLKPSVNNNHTKLYTHSNHSDHSDIGFDDDNELDSVTPVVTRTNDNYTYEDYSDPDVTVDEYEEYNDPILSLIAQETISAESLAIVLRTLPVSDKPLVRFINKAFVAHKELTELLSTINNGWEFIALENNILKAIRPDHQILSNEKSKSSFEDGYEFINSNEDEFEKPHKLFNTDIAKTVLNKCLEFHQKLYEINRSVISINKLVSGFTPLQYISDAGVLLTNLSLKIIELKNEASEKINISYSHAKLIIMGADLDDLLKDFELGENDAASSIINADHPIISNDLAKTIEGYKDFVITILNQLHEAKESQEPEEINECLAVIGDLEKMFEALMKQVYDPDLKTSNESVYESQYESDHLANYNEDDEVELNEKDDIKQNNTSQNIPKSYYETTETPTHSKFNHSKTPQKSGNHNETSTPNTSVPNSSKSSEDISSPSYSNNFDNDTLYDSDSEIGSKGMKSSIQFKHHAREPSTLSSSATLGMMSRSTSTNKFRAHRTTLTEEMPYLLQAFDHAKEAEHELKETLKPFKKPLKNSNNYNSTSAKTSPAKLKFEDNIENEENFDSQFEHPNMVSSINLPANGLGLSKHLHNHNVNPLYTGSQFIRPIGPSANTVTASNPLIIPNEPKINNETESSLSSSIFGWFSGNKTSTSTTKVTKQAALPSPMERLQLPAPPPRAITRTPSGQFLSTSVILKRQPLLRHVESQNFSIDVDID